MAQGDVTVGEIRSAIAKADAQWEAADNPISRLSDEERRLRLGVMPPPGSPTAQEVERMAAPLQTTAPGAPSKFDLRNVSGKNYITPVHDQGNCGSCVAFGSLASVEGTIAWKNQTPNPKIDLSEAHLFYCYGAKDGATCGTGWWPDSALGFCVSGGVVDDACFPYTSGDQTCRLCGDWQKRLTKIRSKRALTSSPAAMKQWISSKGPLAVCFIVYNDFYSYRSGIYRHVTGAQTGGHCVAAVGYDDASGCWICKNSWTTSWGEQGFFRIAYGQCGIETWQVVGVEA